MTPCVAYSDASEWSRDLQQLLAEIERLEKRRDSQPRFDLALTDPRLYRRA